MAPRNPGVTAPTTVVDPPAAPEFHPLAAIDPLMEGADFAALVENIRQVERGRS